MAEDVADNWEALDDVNLDRQLKKLERTVKNISPDEDQNDPMSNRSFISDASITSFKPAFRILKRDSSQSQSSPQFNSTASSKPVRTLEEREAAYAKARLRILGSPEQKPEPVVPDNVALVMNCSSQKKSPMEKTTTQQSSQDRKMLSNR